MGGGEGRGRGTQQAHPNRKHTRSRFRVKDILLPPPQKPGHPKWVGWIEKSKMWPTTDDYPASPKGGKRMQLGFPLLKRFEVSGILGLLSHNPYPLPLTPRWPRQTEIILKLNIRRNSHFMYLEIPIKRFLFVGFLLAILLCFLFALTNFLVIVFHCKHKRPAVICFKKIESRKEQNERRLLINIAKVQREAHGWPL